MKIEDLRYSIFFNLAPAKNIKYYRQLDSTSECRTPNTSFFIQLPAIWQPSRMPNAEYRTPVSYTLHLLYIQHPVSNKPNKLNKLHKLLLGHLPKDQTPQVLPSKPIVTVSPSTITGTLRTPLENFNMLSI
jgi:hypothetical protein